MKKLEIGQYWHRLEDGMEWIVCKEIAGDYFSCECTKQATIWVISEVGHWNYEELIECGYVLGRHPDNIEAAPEWLTLAECKPCVGDVLEYLMGGEIIAYKVSNILDNSVRFGEYTRFRLSDTFKGWRVKSRAAQPEAWQPKEGELVWVKGRKNQGIIFHSPTKGKVVEFEGCLYTAWKHSEHSTTLTNEPLLFLELEPYTDQDKNIDFSKAGQWVKCGDKMIKVTVNEDSNSFWGEHLGGWDSYKFSKDLNWKLLTPEQMKPLLDAYNALTESQND